ncbi:MAG: ROK family transcriptional regulator, partial [Alphaproteobacteria bacterium]
MGRAGSRQIFDPGIRRMEVSGLRINNERAVLTAIATTPGNSAAEIARTTGLGAQSVSRIVGELETTGLVRRGEARRGLRGQPATPLYIDPNGVFSVGCEVGWRHYHILIRNFTGEVLGEHRRDYAFPDIDVVFKEIGSLARLLVGLVPEEYRSRIIGMGLAMPSGIGRNIDLVGGSADQAARWSELDIVATAREASGLEIVRFNDGNAACWAELAALQPPRPANMAYFQVGTFVGAGLIAEGRLWEGPTGNSADLGSMLVPDRSGKLDFVHLVASLHALESRIAGAGIEVPTGN